MSVSPSIRRQRRRSASTVNRPFDKQPSTAAAGSDRRHGSPVAYTRILVPVTASSISDRAVVTAALLASERKAEVILLNVIEVSKDLPLEALFPDEEREGRETLRRATAILDQYGVGSHTRLIRSASAAAAIIEAAAETHPEIIVMGAERRLRRQSRVFSDNVQTVLQAAPCRVMLVSPSPEARLPQRAAGAG
jgi:nucleotide-binding universal stress UspA family protein